MYDSAAYTYPTRETHRERGDLPVIAHEAAYDFIAAGAAEGQGGPFKPSSGLSRVVPAYKRVRRLDCC